MSWFGFGGKKEEPSADSTYDFNAGSTGGGFAEDPTSAFDNSALPSLGALCVFVRTEGRAVCVLSVAITAGRQAPTMDGRVILRLDSLRHHHQINRVRSGGGGGLGGGSQLEELVMAEQQKALVQSVIARLAELAFDNCVAKPSSSLSGSEQSCIQVGEPHHICFRSRITHHMHV